MRAEPAIAHDTLRELKALTPEIGVSLAHAVNGTPRVGLGRRSSARRRRNREEVPASPFPFVGLDRARRIAAWLDGEEPLHKPEQRT